MIVATKLLGIMLATAGCIGAVNVVYAAWGDPQDSGNWRLIAHDAAGQKTFLDTAHFERGNPAEFLVKTDQVYCASRYRMNTCTKVALYAADCKQGKLQYRRDITRDVKGEVVSEWQNPRVKWIYPPSGGALESVLIRACKHNAGK